MAKQFWVVPETLKWLQGRLDSLVAVREGWTEADTMEYADLCSAEKWLLGRRAEAPPGSLFN